MEEYRLHRSTKPLPKSPRKISQIRNALNSIELKHKLFFKSLLLKHYNNTTININSKKYWSMVENHLTGIFKNGRYMPLDDDIYFDYEKASSFFNIDGDSDLGHLLAHLHNEETLDDNPEDVIPNFLMEKI